MPRNRKRIAITRLSRTIITQLLAAMALLACASKQTGAIDPFNDLAKEYVQLALQLQNHDSLQYTYTGPESWRESARKANTSLADIQSALGALGGHITTLPDNKSAMDQRRRTDLLARIEATTTRIDILQGNYPSSFNNETKRMFNVVVPEKDEAHFRNLATKLDELIPGEGELASRMEAFRAQFVIPPGKLPAVIGAGIAECRKRTLNRISLPENESVSINITSDKPWVGFTEYTGNSQSIIHINQDVPIHIERAIELGCHEAYPGHHVHATLVDQELAKKRGWVEYNFIPLYGPLAVIAEGAANYGIDLAFSREERIAFERTTLLPLAGLDGEKLDLYYNYLDLIDALNYARNEVARRYLYGGMPRENAIQWLMEFGLETRGTALQRINFIDALRTYVINYNYGKDLVSNYIRRNAGSDRDAQWQLFREVLETPLSPSDLVDQNAND